MDGAPKFSPDLPTAIDRIIAQRPHITVSEIIDELDRWVDDEHLRRYIAGYMRDLGWTKGFIRPD